jgi:hypothetical protein
MGVENKGYGCASSHFRLNVNIHSSYLVSRISTRVKQGLHGYWHTVCMASSLLFFCFSFHLIHAPWLAGWTSDQTNRLPSRPQCLWVGLRSMFLFRVFLFCLAFHQQNFPLGLFISTFQGPAKDAAYGNKINARCEEAKAAKRTGANGLPG